MDAEDQRRQRNEAVKKELQRRANDEILIFNPRAEDWKIKYGGYIHTVPNRSKDVGYGKGCLVVARYLARHYVIKMVDNFIIEENERVIKKAKAAYKGNHWPEQEQKVALRTNNPKLRKEYMAGLWKGVFRKFGLEETPKDSTGKPEDKRPIDDQLIEELEAELEKKVEIQPEVKAKDDKEQAKESGAKKELSKAIKEEK